MRTTKMAACSNTLMPGIVMACPHDSGHVFIDDETQIFFGPLLYIYPYYCAHISLRHGQQNGEMDYISWFNNIVDADYLAVIECGGHKKIRGIKVYQFFNIQSKLLLEFPDQAITNALPQFKPASRKFSDLSSANKFVANQYTAI